MYLRVASYCIAAVGAFVTLMAMAHGGGSLRSLLSGFTLWALIPYAGLVAASAIARTRGSLIAALAVCLVAVLFGSFIYLDALFVHISSTGALVFIFIPLYQLLAAVVVLVFAAERRRHATRNI
jgi:hypothetical protein